MPNSKTIFVTGGTGNQGGAVAHHLISNGFSIKVLTRNPGSVPAQNLIKLNAELIHGDLNEPGSFRNHLNGVDGIFSVQTFVNGVEKEIQQGINLANLAKEYGIGHFLYSSVGGADLHTGVPHWESKYKIENHIRQIELPYTIIRPASLFENFLIPQVKSRLLKGKLVSPVGKEKIQQFISAGDIGKLSAAIFSNPGKYFRQIITLASEQMDLEQVASIFSNVMEKDIKYQKLPPVITRLVMGRDLYKMFRWINKHDAVFIKDLEAFRKEYSNLTDLRQWVKLYFK
jgi:uncharacterized protein YbjT (DUF2867 family)